MKRLLSVLLLALLLVSCQGSSPNTQGKPLVVTSIPPYVSIVQAIVGDAMVVESAFGIDFDPHNAEPTPSQTQKVQDADLFIGVGEVYERKLIRAINDGPKRVGVLELNEKIPLLSYGNDTNFVDACHDVNLPHNSSKDLHIWLGPEALIEQVPAIITALARLVPKEAELFAQNGRTYIEKIQELNRKLQKDLQPYQNRAIIVSHPSLGYFCHEFNIHQISVECEGKEPLPKDASNILRLAKDSDVICVFTAPQFNNKGAELIGQKLNLRIESFDPLGSDPLETIQQVASAITK